MCHGGLGVGLQTMAVMETTITSTIQKRHETTCIQRRHKLVRSSGSGVFYQAMPAVGADGKNIMKLIPVQMINGQFVKTQTNKPKVAPAPQTAVTIKIASAPVQMVKTTAFNPSAGQQVLRKPVSLMNTLPNKASLGLHNSVNKHPLQQQTVNSMAKVAQVSTNCEKSMRLPHQFPVTVKSPALPRGQYLQIPPNAQVRTVPASELPPVVKKQIFTSSASSSPGSGLPSVVYVSPVTTVNQGVTPSSDSALHLPKLLSMTSNKTSCEAQTKRPKPQLKLIPKASKRPNSPIRWMIEEEDSATAPTLDPFDSPSVTSKILLAVAERENASKRCDAITKPVSQSSQDKSGQEDGNALVMCNGKVFFVAKKSDSPKAATKGNEFNKTMAPSQQLESPAPKKRKDITIVIPDESNEVIDLCDDDAQDDSPQQAASVNTSAVTPLDEDNVIFVSYIPPKSVSGSAQDVILKTQMKQLKETMGTSSSNSVTGRKSLNGPTGADGRTPGQSMLGSPVENLTSVCGPAAMNLHDDEGPDTDSQQSISTQQLENMEVVEAETPTNPNMSDNSNETCSQIEMDTHEMETSSSPSTSQTSSPAPKSDHMLRQIFKITADVKICLQRIDEASAKSVPSEPRQSECIRSAKDNQEPMNGLKEEELSCPQITDSDGGLLSVKRVRADPDTPSPYTHVGPLSCSHFKLNTKPFSSSNCNSGQCSLQQTSCDVEAEPVIDYVEPIDEDFFCTDDHGVPSPLHTDAQPQTPTCATLNTNTRRVGRTRKRTICPCCIPGTQDYAVKSSTKTVDPEKWAWTTEQTSKRGGRTKAVRKDVKASGRFSCLMAKTKHNSKTIEVPASDSLSTTSMDSEELKQHEQIKRLKELLRRKEAALEQIRNSRSCYQEKNPTFQT